MEISVNGIVSRDWVGWLVCFTDSSSTMTLVTSNEVTRGRSKQTSSLMYTLPIIRDLGDLCHSLSHLFSKKSHRLFTLSFLWSCSTFLTVLFAPLYFFFYFGFFSFHIEIITAHSIQDRGILALCMMVSCIFLIFSC